MNTYDYLAMEAIKHLECYKMLKDLVIEKYGEKAFDELEEEGCKDWKRLQGAVDKYYADIKGHKKVGYSAEE